MRRLRRLVSTFLSLALLFSIVGLAPAAEEPTTSLAGYETVTTFKTTVRAGVAHRPQTFTVQSALAELTVEAEGQQTLYLTVNGQLIVLPFFAAGSGSAVVDLADFITYGSNTLAVKQFGGTDATATISIAVPVMELRLLHFNDFHAKLDRLPKMAAYVNGARAEADELIFLSAGDNFSGNPVSDLNYGQPVIELFNLMGLDLMTMGNHEFDHGAANTTARLHESDFPWLAANAEVKDPSATPFEAFTPYEIYETEAGHRVAFIGTVQAPPATAVKNIEGLAFADPIATTQAYIDALKNDVNAIVVISHSGVDFDQEMAKQLKGAHLIIGAHSHTYLEEPLVVNGIPIVQAGSDGKYLGDLKVRQIPGHVRIAPGAAEGKWTVAIDSLTETDEATAELVTTWKTNMESVLNAKIGETATKLDRDDRWQMDVSIGNLISDAARAYFDADIGLTNSGGIRNSIEAGDITMGDVYAVQPFGNWVDLIELTGEQLKEVIIYSYTRGGSTQTDLQVSGMSYTFFVDAQTKELKDVEILVGGEPLDLTKTYTVALPDFMTAGGDGYPFPSMTTPIDKSAETDAIVTANYIKALGTINYAHTEGRAVIKAVE